MSTLSPSRKFHSNYISRKESYTQHRQENLNQNNLSQYSPSIRSPRLNQESEYSKLHNANLIDELKIKLQTVMKHNSHLLNQNATLSEMVNNLKMQIQMRSRREQSELVKASAQFTTVIQELRGTIQLKQVESARLLDEISRLHDECYRIEVVKNNQIKQLAENNQKQMAIQIRNFKKATDDSKELLELQIKKLKQSIQLKNYEYQALKSLSKGQTQKLRSEVQELRNQIKHCNQLKEIDLRQLNEKHKEIINSISKNSERENNLVISKLQTKIRKLKQDVVNKNIEIQQTMKKIAINAEDHQLQIDNLNNERQRLIEEINVFQTSGKENIQKEKQKLRNLGEMELRNLENIAQNQKDCLKSQINKLMIVCNSKTEEIKKLYMGIADTKQAMETERKERDRLIDNLRKRIKNLEEDNLEQLELLKVKMAQLHEADVKGLQRYYENEIVILSKQIKDLQAQSQADRQKIHKYLQENDLLRKNFDTQLTKYKAKVQDYKVKFAAAHLQFREQITSIGTKMSLTSQTLLRETEQKQKGAQFFEAQKKKFHLLILGKDKQISSLQQTLKQLKELHGDEIKQLREELHRTRQSLNAKITQIKDLRKEFEQEYERKSQKLIAQQKQNPNDTLIADNKSLRDKLENVEKQLFQKIKEMEFLQRQNKSLHQEVGLRAGFLETMQLQSSAAIEDERSKMKILMNENEVAMKDYFESKIASKSKQVESLTHQLQQKQHDIRQLIVKYNQLEKRLKQILETQDRLSELEKKIMNLGLDQNLVKNMSQLFGKYRK